MIINANRLRTAAGAAMFFLIATCGFSQQVASQQDPGNPSDVTSMDLEKLMDIEVTTASRFSDKLSEAPSIMSVVTSDELQRFGGLTLGEILDRVPGLTQTSQYFTDRSLVAADGDQTKTSGAHILFLINGRPTREVMEGGIISDLLESFPVEILERIEIIRGPGSVLYGSNAFSAVVNLITRKADADDASVRGLVGVNGALAASGHFLFKRGDFSMVGASQIHEAPDWNLTYLVPPPLQDNPDTPPEPPFHDTTMIDRGIGDYLGMNYKGLSFMSAFTEWQTTAFVQGAVGETRQTREFANLGYDYKARDNWDMNFHATDTRTTFLTFSYPYTDRDSNEIVGEWTNLITLTSKDRLTPESVRPHRRNRGGQHQPQRRGRRGQPFRRRLLRPNRSPAIAERETGRRVPVQQIRGYPAFHRSPGRGDLDGVAHRQRQGAVRRGFRPPSLDEISLNLPNIHGNPNLRPEIVETLTSA